MRIEPFDPSKHDRTGFTCGLERVDNFFKKTAGKLSRADNSSVRVMVHEDGSLIGFYAINTHSLHYSELPAEFAKDRPGHGMIPAVYLSMIGRNTRFKGKEYGSKLLLDCLTRIGRASTEVGIKLVVLDVMDCGDPGRTARRRALYLDYGFKSLPDNPHRMILPTKTIRRMMGID